MRYRRFRYSTTTITIVSVAVFVTVFNICLIVLYLFSVPPLRFATSGGIYAYSTRNVFPPLFDSNATDPEPECGESKGKLLKTGWALKLLNVAMKELRRYRKRELENMEAGREPNGYADIFTDLQPILAAFTADGEKPNLMALLPKILSVYFKIKNSGMFDSSPGNGFEKNDQQNVNPQNLPLVDFELLDKLLALKSGKLK
ncbi:uncharacterized protein LOC129587032 [Paramacrobiotus metropolitanus]|uniref:uncharacterized protein LOC129587032 n=1 Tax=Paramacrobiotus metropolitanus TaxID=2943436 RepID=UPI002445BD1A|nr:uncharacterized protein LOC129587032 [Paramacrobiotus metropolitanus]